MGELYPPNFLTTLTTHLLLNRRCAKTKTRIGQQNKVNKECTAPINSCLNSLQFV